MSSLAEQTDEITGCGSITYRHLVSDVAKVGFDLYDLKKSGAYRA